MVWQSQGQSGSTIESLSLPKFEGPTPPKFSAPGGLVVDIPAENLKNEISKLTQNPAYAYLNDLQIDTNRVKWNQVNLAYERWSFRQDGLTPAGASLLAIAITVATAGTGSGVDASLMGAESATASAIANAAINTLVIQASKLKPPIAME